MQKTHKNSSRWTYLEAIGSTFMVYTSKTCKTWPWSIGGWGSGKRAMPGNSSRSKGKRSCKSRCLEQKKWENSPSKMSQALEMGFSGIPEAEVLSDIPAIPKPSKWKEACHWDSPTQVLSKRFKKCSTACNFSAFLRSDYVRFFQTLVNKIW